MREIVVYTQVQFATCGNIIREAKKTSKENGYPDLCADQNIAPKPDAEKGCNAVVTQEERQAPIDLTLSDFEHCRMSFDELAREGGLIQIGTVNSQFT